MSRVAVALGLTTFVGATLLLAELRWFRRPGLVERLRPYATTPVRERRTIVPSAESFVEILTPIAADAAGALARLVGATEDLETRLRRVHAPVDPVGFRVRQSARAGLGFVVGAALSAATGAPPLMAILLTLGTPLIVFLRVEQRLAAESDTWKERVFQELPVIAEQLGMLISAGWSIGAALQRIAVRGRGACAVDLRRVTARIQQGLSDAEALREWSATADVDALHRLVAVLTLNRDAADLDRLIAQEARAMRRDAHRQLVATIERRTQQVWVPVTVAALVPGVLLMGVPFVDALTLFST